MVDTRKLKNFDFGCATELGKVRGENEDYLAYFECINGHVFVVCDGMGGHAGGSTASRIAVEAVREYLENHYFDLPEDAMRETITFANQAVLTKALENPQLSGMGTTIVLVIIRHDKVYYAHVGDSRLYLMSEGKLTRLTSDHSFVQTLVDQGLLEEDDMERHPRRNEISRALGIQEEVAPAISLEPLRPVNGDTLMLCTDGLNSMLSAEKISEVLATDEPAQQKVMRLIEQANEAGGFDNITVQLIHFYNVSNKKTDPGSPVYRESPAPVVSTPTENKKPLLTKKMKKYFLYIVLGIAILAIVYFLWDMFGSSGNPLPMAERNTDTVTEQPVTQTDEAEEEAVATPEPEPAAPAVKTGDTLWSSYTVKSGDVLSKISGRFGVSNAVLIKKNNLKGDMIRLDQVLQVPVKARHTVASGETIDAIAKKYRSDSDDILKANGLKSKTLSKGKTLLIPF